MASAQTPTPTPTPGPQTTPTATATPTPITQPTPEATPLPAHELPAPPPAIAPDYEAPPRPLPSAERVGVDVAEQTPLTLQDAITLALENNNDIDTARIDVQLAEFDLTTARSVYDPRLTSETYYERQKVPSASSLGATNGALTQSNFGGSARLAGFSPRAGGSYQFDFTSSRQTTDNPFTSLNPQYPSAFSFTYTQPLLRGRRFDDNRRRIEIARKNLSLTDAQFRQRTIEIVAQVEQAYWNLVFALRNLQVQIDAVKQARTQVESNQRQVAQGVLAPIDIVAANNQVATFEQNVYTAQETVTRAENALKTLLLPDRNAALWNRALVPVTPVEATPPSIALGEAVTNALRNRPEIAQLTTSAEINAVNTRYFREQNKPQVDLFATYTSAGLAGSLSDTGNPFNAGSAALTARVNQLSVLAGLPPLPVSTSTGSGIPDNLNGGYFQSFGNLLAQNYPTVRVGVRVNLPLRSRAGEAAVGRSLAEGTRITNQRAQSEQLIEADVRNTLQTMRSVQARLTAAAAARETAELQAASEQRKFQAGTSTVFLVLQRQQELVAARGRELQAQTDLNRAIADFQRATGNTLQINNIVINEELRTPRPTGTDAAHALDNNPASLFTLKP